MFQLAVLVDTAYTTMYCTIKLALQMSTLQAPSVFVSCMVSLGRQLSTACVKAGISMAGTWLYTYEYVPYPVCGM